MNRPTRIAIVTPDYYPNNLGGCGISANLLRSALVSKKYNVDVFSFDNANSIESDNNGVVRRFKGYPKVGLINALIAGWKLRNQLSGYDLIHIFNMDMIPAVVWNKNRPVKVIATINNPKGAEAEKSRSNKPVLNILLNIHNILLRHIIWYMRSKVDNYIALTHSLKKLYVSVGYSKENIIVIPNMADPIFDTQRVVKKHLYRLLYVGQLSHKKGVGSLLVTFAEYVKTNPNTKLILTICGKGQLAEWIEKFIVDNKLSIYVKLITARYEDLPKIYQSHDVLIHPAEWFEPFSRTWLEAMQSGLQIISTRNPSALEILDGNATFYSSKKELTKLFRDLQIDNVKEVDYQSLLDLYRVNRVVKLIMNLY